MTFHLAFDMRPGPGMKDRMKLWPWLLQDQDLLTRLNFMIKILVVIKLSIDLPVIKIMVSGTDILLSSAK
jgi:hypothetical protein